MTSSSWLLLLFDDCYRLIWIFADFSELFRGFDSIYCRFLFVIDVVWDYRYRFTDWSMTSSLRSWRHTSDFSRCLDAIPLTSSTTLEDFFFTIFNQSSPCPDWKQFLHVFPTISRRILGMLKPFLVFWDSWSGTAKTFFQRSEIPRGSLWDNPEIQKCPPRNGLLPFSIFNVGRRGFKYRLLPFSLWLSLRCNRRRGLVWWECLYSRIDPVDVDQYYWWPFDLFMTKELLKFESHLFAHESYSTIWSLPTFIIGCIWVSTTIFCEQYYQQKWDM